MENFELSNEQEIITDIELLEWQDDILNSEEAREFEAKELGLDSNTDWETIANRKDEISFNKIKQALGLSLNATTEEMFKEEERQGVSALSHLVCNLDLNYDATSEEIQKAEETKRERKIKKLRLIFEHMRANKAKNIDPRNLI
ncbi:MAG: hypothetical protein RLY43_1303 [Bacteroidota bacterium]|jgi:hypothetical protein